MPVIRGRAYLGMLALILGQYVTFCDAVFLFGVFNSAPKPSTPRSRYERTSAYIRKFVRNLAPT